EYILTLRPGHVTPAPWVNVIANPFFGTVVSEGGSSYTWLENSHEYRLTPWHNDPVVDPSGEVLYLRDEETGQFWSPTPLPVRTAAFHTVRHGFGYSVFECRHLGIESELWIYVALDAPIKFAFLTLRNRSGRTRRISATAYWEWVLGELRHKTALHVVTDLDPKLGLLVARNAYSPDFPTRMAFVDVSETTRSHTADRAEFLGKNGGYDAPAAMARARLSGRTGPGLDPCAALQTPIELADGQSRDIVFTLGVARDQRDLADLSARFRGVQAARAALEQVWQHWNHVLSGVRVETPDKALDVLANGWLQYQVLSCRMWGRTGFYQSGGAFGFRDQLQDAMAMATAEPMALRNQVLRAARHQFREGDVQHWWHPPHGRGVRTHFSDDYLWLPFAVCRYVTVTADTGVLDERVPFLDGRPVASDEEAYYDLPMKSEEVGTLYEHCVRSIQRGLRFGVHGLPLIGCGDWNDGMNRVGTEHKGESVWLAFFLGDVLRRFAEIARRRGDAAFAEHCLTAHTQLKRAVEDQAWDGEWYRRAYFDDGTPLGSKENDECQIDALPQSWAVLSGMGDPERVRQAMAAVERRLVKRDAGIIKLFDPPFDKGTLEPGYIKGYVPGVRENGGQYTHAALWTIMAFAELGERTRAWDLFQMVCPINHARTPAEVAVYKVEPYVACADVYAVAPHVGRGGWTWYTGSAGWMYRLIVETFLGLRVEGERLLLKPRVPDSFGPYTITYRFRETAYRIVIAAGASGERITLDGQPLDD
ncbi:MAG: cyclic beta 1-2 glucan synthetase, partial [Planctomycetes bacterium]|nr:cyclic beta 1-2 glucan synthetase [Planctomycetota bacterium]